MADGNLTPSSITLDSLLSDNPNKRKNPYMDRLLSRPSLQQGPLDGNEKSLADRFWIDQEAGYRSTIMGAGEAALYSHLPNPGMSVAGDVENSLRMDRIRQGQRAYDAMAPARTPLEIGVAVAGHLAGAARSPETFAALPTRLVTAGASALTRVLRAGASGAAINTAIDPAVQSLRISAGLQDTYSPSQTVAAAALGFGLPAVAQVGAEAIRVAPRAISEPRAAPAAEIAQEPPAPATRPAATGPEADLRKIDTAVETLRTQARQAEVAPDVASGFDMPPQPQVTYAKESHVEQPLRTAVGSPESVSAKLDPNIGVEGFTVFHGSPHTFDQFDIGKIGTGEGAQAFGHGIYFAQGEDVARYYSNIERRRAGWATTDTPPEMPPGNLYEVRINAKPDDFLDWDKPIAKQPESVRSVLFPEGIGPESGVDLTTPTGVFVDNMRSARGSKATTEALRQAGIAGIRYLDQGSRATGEGTSNFVVFDDNLLTTIRRNDDFLVSGTQGKAEATLEDPARTIFDDAITAARAEPETNLIGKWRNMQSRLRERGYSNEQIKGITPQEAETILAVEPAMVRDVPTTITEHQTFIGQQPARDFDEIYSIAPANQARLEDAGQRIAKEIGAEFKSAGLKDRATAEGKIERKGYQSTSQITDIVRGGFIARVPAQADAVIAALSREFKTFDEGWKVNAFGWFDRKVLVQFDDGMIGEVQLWEPNLYAAKERDGHQLYDEARALPPGDPRREELAQKQIELYSEALRSAEPDWGNFKSPNALLKAASETTEPLSPTSAQLTSVQPAPGESTAQALPASMTAGRPSQLTSRRVTGADVEGSGSRIKPPPVPEFDTSVIPPTPGQRAGIFIFDPRQLRIDAKTFQFKAGGDAEGVTPILRNVTKWDADAAGQIVVWERDDGELFVADGHQRVGLAKRLLEDGSETNITIPASLYRESDGFGAEDVMVLAALKNIREGSGDSMDAARILRTTPEAVDQIGQIGRAQTRQSVGLANLSPDVWRMAVNEVVTPRDAAIVGRLIADPELQGAAARLLARVKPASEAEAEILVRRVRDSETVQREQGAQGSLLGDLEQPESLVAEETKIVAAATRTLARDRNIMRRVVANAERIEETGSRIDRGGATQVADEAQLLSRMIETLAFSRGPARERLIELAKGLKDASITTADAAESFVEAVRLASPISGERSVQPGGRGFGTPDQGQGAGGGAGGEAAKVEPIKIGTGARLRSGTGRELSPAPRIDFSSEKKTANTLKRVDDWLVKEAIAEAQSAGDDFVLTQVRGLDPKKLSSADRDFVNQFLFGNTVGATAEHLMPEDLAAMRMPIQTASVERLQDSLKAQYGLDHLRLHLSNLHSGTLVLDMIEVPRVARGKGVGSRVMTDIVEFADRSGLRMLLTPALKDERHGTTSRSRLVAFYKRFGFVENKGRNKDFSTREGMIRKPRASGDIFPMRLEPGADNLPQAVIPGAERVSDATLAQRRADQPLRPKRAQKTDVGPLFSDGSKQMDLVDMARAAGRKDETPSDLFGFIGFRKGAPLRGETDRSSTGVAAGNGPAAQRLKDISEQIVGTLGMTVRQGRIAIKGAAGQFSKSTGVTRLKELDAFDVLVHEGGHAIHLRPQNKTEVDAVIAAHAPEVERLAYAGAKPGTERQEGFAEWFRLWMTNPLYAAREAPNFTADFTRWMETKRPEQFTQLAEAQLAYQDWLRAPSKDMVTGDLVTSAKPPLPPRLAKALGPDRLPTGESLFSMFDRFYTWTLDRLHPVNRAVHSLLDIHQANTGQRIELHAANDAYKLLRLATNAYQSGHMDLSYGVIPYRKLDPEGPALAEGLELAAGKNWFGYWRSDDLLDFGGYLVARRSITEFERFLAGEVPNPPGKMTLGDYRQAVSDYERQNPNFAKAADLVYKWQSNLLRKKFEAGLVTRSFYEGALAKKDYVPFRRDFSEKVDELIRAVGTGGTNRQSVMKTYRGSLRSIINPVESMIADAYDTAAIIARNDAVNAIDDLAKKAGQGAGAIAERIPANQMKPIKVDIAEALRSAGKDVGLLPDDIDEMVRQAEEALGEDNLRTTLFRAGETQEKGEPIIYGWKGGERYALRLANGRFGKELFEAITQIGGEQSNWAIDLLAVPARALRAGITTSPEFLLANYTRDQISAFVLNTRFVPFVSGARGAWDEVTQGKAARLYAQAGGIMGGANVASLDQARIGRSITALQKKGYNIRRMADLREVVKLTEISETGTRIALFKQYYSQARRNGLNEYEALVEGAFEARDYMDFGRHGSKMLFARRVVTFMNAALQGTDKTMRVLVGDLRPLARVFRGETLTQGERDGLTRSVSAWGKIAALTALSATYAAIYRDDPEFQDASEYLRATNWLFKVPGGQWVAVPKPYEMATIMNLGERAAEALMANDPTWAERWLRSWAYTLSVPMEPTGLMVPAEVMFNHDTFRDRPIVPDWQLGLEPALQFNSYTSEFSKAVGKALNVSPAKIDHLLVGWGGSWGRNVLSASNAIADPQRRSEMLYDWPVTGRFVKNLARGADASDKFYGLVSETGGRLEVKNNTFKHFVDGGQQAEAESYYGGLRDDEKVWVALNQQEKADNKRVHPLRRASDIAEVLNGVRRDIINRDLVGAVTKKKIDVNPTMASALLDQIARVSADEMRNALVTVGEPGWAQREIIPADQFYDAVRTLSPEVANEIDARLTKKKVLPFEGVQSVWPELRDRLLRDGANALVGDLRAKAIRAGGKRQSHATELPARDMFQGVSLPAP